MNLAILFVFASVLNSVSSQECPPDKCQKYPPNAKCGLITMTVFYDNDDPNDLAKPNAEIIKRTCDVLHAFGSEFSAEFYTGVTTKKKPDSDELICKTECTNDRLDACASLHVKDCAKFVCCRFNANGDAYKCANDQGVSNDTMKDCLDNRKSDDTLLKHSKMREDLKIPDCYIPVFLLNNKLEKCLRISNSQELTQYLCRIYVESNFALRACGNYD